MGSGSGYTRRQFIAGSVAAGAGGLMAASLGTVSAAQSKGPRWRIGCYTRPWGDQDYRVALDSIVEAGFKYVGLMTTNGPDRLVLSVNTPQERVEDVAEEVAKRKLEVLSVYGGGIPVNKSLKAGIEGLRRLIDNCAACGCKSLLMGGTGNPDQFNAYYKAISECCDYAAEKGMEIVVKPHGGLNATGPQCRKTVELVGNKNFHIWYDPGNIFYYSDGKLDPVIDAETVDGLVTGMCVKDYKHPKEVAITPGTGRVDFPRVFKVLADGGFKGGSLVIECVARGDVKQSIVEARKTRRFLEQLLDIDNSKSKSEGPAHTNRLKAGVSTIDITPPAGYRMSGYFRERQATGTLNPLKARAMVLDDGQTRAAIVSCDVIGLSPEVSGKARRMASKKTGINADNILLAATHTHTGPLYWGALRDHFHKLAVAEHGEDPCEKVDYPAMLAAAISKAICEAGESAEPSRLEAGKATQQGLSFNRRFHMKDGSVRFNPGINNPDIVKVAGPVDPQVSTIVLRQAATSRRMAAMVNFALHLDTTGGTEYAADYPYYLEQSLKTAYGGDFTALFGTGTCGDINHIDVTTKDRAKPDAIGSALGETVTTSGGTLDGIEEPILAVSGAVVKAPLQEFTADEVAWARESIRKVGTKELSFLDQVKAYKILAVLARGAESIDLEVQVIRLDANTAIVGLPGEVFVDIGLAIKQASPFATTLVIELCQDAPGYIPTSKAFAEGSYETVNSRVAPGGGELLQETAIKLLKSLKVQA